MARSELPDNWQDLAAGYVLNNLSDEEVASWEALIEEHPELSNELEELQSTLNLFADTLPMYQPSQQLLGQIRATAQAEWEMVEPSQSSIPVSGSFREQGSKPVMNDRFRVLTSVGGAIAASVIALLGFQLYSLQSQLQQANATIQTLERDLQQAQTQAQSIRPVVNTLQQPGTLIYSLEGSDLANTASGRLVVSDEQEVIILVRNLPELPSGRVYRLWAALPTQTTLTYCGQFNSNTQGIIQLTPSSRQCGDNPTQMIITVDGATDPTTKGGPVVLQGRI
ncbi:anti-sigma factor [Oscillatoria sp. FACHB-1407]|uniref:anti-sigma factor n=1 Tax=Oscillatoria sp. FACHB-1407 TaxID=2692847 RepID=UPI0016823DD7|nr:anti-sigma factor [Oscillatoria sp. FACHB-1407]MBD2464449.1 anti-sigma factor [Oscillatoria sp. FACHB-1407]